MATEVIMPKVDMVMETAILVEWLKQAGDQVEKGEPLFVIMTEKASIEIEAPASGILAGVRAKADDVVPVAEVIAYILQPGETLPTEDLPKPAPPPSPPLAAGWEAIAAAQAAGSAPEAQALEATDGKARATPVARRLAAELGVDLADVSGRGPRGRIQKEDVLASAERRPAAEPLPIGAGTWAGIAPVRALQIPLPAARQKQVVPLAGPRKIIAERMAYSASTAPHITLTLSVDMAEAARLRAHLVEPLERRTGQRLSYTALLVQVVASVLPRHPYLNASLAGDEIILWEDVHLGIATSLEDYLIVPVIREAQCKSLEQIVVELGDLIGRARTKRLTPSEMTGSTFTITNLGMFGIESFTAIINPPESAILAVGKIMDAPRDAAAEEQVRSIMHLTLSADHRVVDGASAARFLADLKSTMENPYLLI